MNLNQRAVGICRQICDEAVDLRVEVHQDQNSGRWIDCGSQAEGGLEAGRRLAEVCLAGLGRVSFAPGNHDLWPGVSVAVRTDHPLAACMASQYAGWKIAQEKFFAMGSGPMRAAYGDEPLFDKIGFRETDVDEVVGVLETAAPPPSEVFEKIASACHVRPPQVTLLSARTASLAGTVQITARSLETALHKLIELGFDPHQIVSGSGAAPLPPVAADDLAGIGRTNDAVLYGAEATLWVRGDDQVIEKFGRQTPSSASSDYGRPFQEIFAHYDHDFYKIDPLLFSPAVVSFVNLNTGRHFRFGEFAPDILRASFEAG